MSRRRVEARLIAQAGAADVPRVKRRQVIAAAGTPGLELNHEVSQKLRLRLLCEQPFRPPSGISPVNAVHRSLTLRFRANSLQVALGERIRELRKKAGYSQEGFADAADVHSTYMGTLERGEANVSLGNLSKISTALSITLSELFRGVDKRTEALRKHGITKRT